MNTDQTDILCCAIAIAYASWCVFAFWEEILAPFKMLMRWLKRIAHNRKG